MGPLLIYHLPSPSCIYTYIRKTNFKTFHLLITLSSWIPLQERYLRGVNKISSRLQYFINKSFYSLRHHQCNYYSSRMVKHFPVFPWNSKIARSRDVAYNFTFETEDKKSNKTSHKINNKTKEHLSKFKVALSTHNFQSYLRMNGNSARECFSYGRES